MAEGSSQSSLSMYAMKYIAMYFFMFIAYLIVSIPATYNITTNLRKNLSNTKPNNKFITPMVTVTLFVLPVVLDLLFFVNALKFTYYKLYMRALHLHVNIYNLAKPDVNLWIFELLLFTIFPTFLYYSYKTWKVLWGQENETNVTNNKEHLIRIYHKTKLIGDIIDNFTLVIFCGFCLLFLLWFMTYDNTQLSKIHEESGYSWSMLLILCTCFSVIGLWFNVKENVLKEQIGSEDDQVC